MMFGRKQNNNDEGLRALEEQLNKFEAERKTLYSIIDKLTGCIEETNRRFDGLISQIESLENRITDIELRYDCQHQKIVNMENDYFSKYLKEKEDMNEE